MKKKNYVIAAITFILFLILILLLKTVDVAAVGAGGTDIGLSKINVAFHDLTGVNMTMYKITDFLGIISFALIGVFGLKGLIQWIKRRNILKVDREILAMGIMFLVTLAIYFLFTKVVVNYRPIIMPGETEPEASFPSSHTVMAITVMGSIAMVLDKYVANIKLVKILHAACIAGIIIMIAGRLLSGVHWLTDIIGGVLISTTLLLLYDAQKTER